MIAVTLCVLTLSLQQPWRAVDSALGRSGSLQGETYRVGFPRNDLHVTVGAVTVRPALALGSWVAFKQTKDSLAMLMGDLGQRGHQAELRVPHEASIQREIVDDLQRSGDEEWCVDPRRLCE